MMMAILFLPFLGLAQQQPNVLALQVAGAKAQKSTFQPVMLFEAAGNAKTNAVLSNAVVEGQLLRLDPAALKALYTANAETIELELPSDGPKSMRLELVRHQLLADDFTVVTDASNGQGIPYQPGAYYRGIVKGDNSSVAAISVFENEVIGVISTEALGNLVLGKTGDPGKSGMDYILYQENDLLGDPGFSCGANEEAVGGPKDPDGAGAEKVAKCVRAYLECEYDLVTEKGGATGAVNYVTGLFNAVASLYQNEAITTYISQVFTWTSADPYATSSSSAALDSFRNYRTTYNGDVAHLISRGAPTGGGIAWVDALCTSYAYAYSYINSTYQQVPTYSWSVNVIAHEMGHNLGSPHTHACSWNGNNTAIDGCGPAVGANEGCNAAVPTAGTMMSYCHLISGVGINFNLGFGPQPGDRIRSRITNASCLVVCAAPCATVTTTGTNPSCFGTANGSATATVTGGTAPYTYAWSNGGTAQSINNLAAGTYTVTITTSTGCTSTGSRVVTQPTAIATSTAVTPSTGGLNNGAIDLTVSGGTPAYTYLWSNAKTTQDISGLAPGTYTVTVTDSKGCTSTKSATVATGGSTPISLSFAITNTTNGLNNGAIDLSVSGGTAPFTYLWSNGASTQDLANLAAGTYYVTVTGANASSATGNATVAGSTSGSGCTPANLPHSQSFENGLGAWSQATNDQIDWAINSGTTPTANTGPTGAYNGTYYIYAEATNNANKIGNLLSPCFQISGIASFQLSFAYHMKGTQMGSLKLQYSVNGSSTWYTAWTKSGNQGANWKTQSITFNTNGLSSIQFRFSATIGGNLSDICVDNVGVTQVGNLPGDGPGLDGAVVQLGQEAVPALELSPNPASGSLRLRFAAPQGQTAGLRLSDQLGKPVLEQSLPLAEGRDQQHDLDVSDLPPGLYFLTLTIGGERWVEKLVVAR